MSVTEITGVRTRTPVISVPVGTRQNCPTEITVVRRWYPTEITGVRTRTKPRRQPANLLNPRTYLLTYLTYLTYLLTLLTYLIYLTNLLTLLTLLSYLLTLLTYLHLF